MIDSFLESDEERLQTVREVVLSKSENAPSASLKWLNDHEHQYGNHQRLSPSRWVRSFDQ